MHIQPRSFRPFATPVAVVLGTGDIASAIARAVFLAGWGVVMLRDPSVPVLRRGMALDGALEDGVAELDGVFAVPAPGHAALPTLASSREAVVLSPLSLAMLGGTCPGMASLLIDARMRKYATPADLRLHAGCAIGVGPGFVAGENVDVAIETLPGHEGGLVTRGATASPTGRAVPLGGAGKERFVHANEAGAWTPLVVPGAWVMAGQVLGRLGLHDLTAPIDGRVRGLVRGVPGGIAPGCKLAELDPRHDAPCQGVPPRAQAIADGVLTALETLLPARLSLMAE